MDYSQSPFDGTQACRGLTKVELNVFFPDKEDDDPKEYLQKVSKAKSICIGCPIRKACLLYALEHTSLSGVWGGTTTAQRTKMRRSRNMGVLI